MIAERDLARIAEFYGEDLTAALRTEWRTYGEQTRFELRKDVLVVREPEVPKHYETNSYWLLRPQSRSLEEWLAAYREDFPPETHGHVVMIMLENQTTERLLEEAPRHGLSTMKFDFMRLANPPEEVKLREGYRIRSYDPLAEVEQSIAYALKAFAHEDWFRPEHCPNLTRIAAERYRELGVHALTVSPEGSDRMCAKMGVFFEGARARLQAVSTLPEFYRQGFCKALLSHTARFALERAEDLLLLTERDSAAQGIYRRMGFETLAQGMSQIHLFP